MRESKNELATRIHRTRRQFHFKLIKIVSKSNFNGIDVLKKESDKRTEDVASTFVLITAWNGYSPAKQDDTN